MCKHSGIQNIVVFDITRMTSDITSFLRFNEINKKLCALLFYQMLVAASLATLLECELKL